MGFILDARFLVGVVVGAAAYHFYMSRKTSKG
jgi:hypothetical protein